MSALFREATEGLTADALERLLASLLAQTDAALVSWPSLEVDDDA